MKKIISLFMVIAMMCTVLAVPVGAVSTSQHDVSQLEMEKYFTLTADGLILFDTNTAANDGISQDDIIFVQSNVTVINSLVSTGEAYINSDFHAISYSNRARSVTGGVTGYDYAWDGSLLIYLNSDDTKKLINDLNGGEDVATGLLGIFGAPGLFSGLYTALNQLTILQLTAANRGDTGVVINVKPNFDTGGQDIYIWPQ